MKYKYYICYMVKNIKSIAILLFLLCSTAATTGYAQEKQKASLTFDIYDHSFFDNREVRTPYQRSQTLFGSMLSLEGGVEFGAHMIMAGVHAIKDFGKSGLTSYDLTFYYHYEEGHFSGAFGSFPRRLLRRDLPDIFVYDSVRYYTPTLHGALLQYTGEHGYAEVYCNWLNKQGAGQREIFEIVTDGRFGQNGFYGGWYIQLTHFSVPRPSDKLKVYDKLMINPHIGIEKSRFGWLDSFALEGGLMLSLNRDRNDMLWHTPLGFMGELRLRKWRLEIQDRLYAGNPQFTHYDTYGAQLHRGDPYYQSSFYNRTDIRFYLLNRSYVQCYAAASLHLTEGALDNSQQVVLRIYPQF